MRLRQIRMRTVMLSIAFLALILAVFVQTIRLQRAVAREQLLRAEAEQQRDMAEQQRDMAEAHNQRARAVVDQMLAGPDRSGEKRQP
jgi:hypothetical protein